MLRCHVSHPSAAYRRGLGSALADDVYDVLEDIEGHPADVVLLYVDGDAWDRVERLVSDEPVVVALLPDLDVGAYRQALALGVDGICDANLPPEMIARVVDAAVAGEVRMPAETARRLASGGGSEVRPRHLTEEERALLQQHADGASIAELARDQYLGERTVRRRLQNVCVKLGTRTRPEAIKRATQLGIIG